MFSALFQTLYFRVVFSGIMTFLAAIVIGPRVIANLKLRQIGQTIREEGVQEHKKKAGIPTMGGMIILLPALITLIFWVKVNILVVATIFCTIGMALLGMLDDSTKVLKARSLGLTPRQKLFGQILIAAVVGISILKWQTLQFNWFNKLTNTTVSLLPSAIQMPFFSPVDLSWCFLPFVIFVIVAFTNAINLTDGLDGLAATTCTIAFFAVTLMAIISGNEFLANKFNVVFIPGAEELAVIGASLIGGCLGFLWFNAHPAQVFMGDTGSMALGGAFGAMAVCLKSEFFFAIVGGLFALEALSVVLQVVYFKNTGGKRIFRMSPIHHHFELCGWPEEKVVTRFSIVAFLFAVIGFSIFSWQAF